jgi:hypothetical protein
MADRPWPTEGLPLATALRRLEPDPQVLDLRVFGGAALTTPLLVRRLCALVAEGQYTLKGRRGASTAELQSIPADALPYLDFDRADHSELQERRQEPRGAAGMRWFGVRVYMPVPDFPATAAGRTARALLKAYPDGRPLIKNDNLAFNFKVGPTTLKDALRLLRERKIPGW